jgi:hypothetical protein
LAPVSNDEISNEAETGGETNVPAIQDGEVLEPHDVAEELVAPESAIQDGEILVPQDVAEELVAPESGFERTPVVQTDSMEHEPIESEDLPITWDVGAVVSETEDMVTSNDVMVDDATTEVTEQPQQVAALDGVDHSDGVMSLMGESFDILFDDITFEESEVEEVIALKGVTQEIFDVATGDEPEKGDSSTNIDHDMDDLDGGDDAVKEIVDSQVDVSAKPDSSEKLAGSKPNPLAIIKDTFNKIFRRKSAEKEKDQEDIETIKASLEILLKSLPRSDPIVIDVDGTDDHLHELEVDTRHGRPIPFKSIRKSFGKFLRRKIASDE